MSIGAGIVVATILIIAAWQIDKRKAWKKAGLWIGGGVLILCALVGGYIWWDDLQSDRRRNTERTEARNPDGKKYRGVSPGMTKNEVRYALGEPTKSEPLKNEKVAEYWSFVKERSTASDPQYLIYWDRNERVAGVECFGGSALDGCERVGGYLGIEIGSTEQHVREVLGTPTDERPPDESGAKRLRYRGNENAWVFFLEREKVARIALVSKAALAQ